MPVIELKSHAEYLKQIVQSEGVAIVDAFATWCGPCKAIAPVLEKMSDEFPNAKFYSFDVDAVPEVAQELGITAMPTITAFKDGDKVDSVRGANPPGIKAMVEKAVA